MAAGLEFPPDLAINEKGTVLRNVDEDLTVDVFLVRPMEVYRKFMSTHPVLHVGRKSKVEAEFGAAFYLSAQNQIAAAIDDADTAFRRRCLEDLHRNADKRKRSNGFLSFLEIHGIVGRDRSCAKAVLHLQLKPVSGFELYLLLQEGHKRKSNQDGHSLGLRLYKYNKSQRQTAGKNAEI